MGLTFEVGAYYREGLQSRIYGNLIRCKEFNLEYDGGFHFSIDQKFWLNNLFDRLAIFGIFLKDLLPLFELQE